MAATDEGEHCVRFTPPAEWNNLSLSLLTEDGRVPIPWDRDGSCCVFTVSGTHFTIAVENQRKLFPMSWIWAAVVLTALVSGFLVIRVIKVKRSCKAMPTHKDEDPEAPGRSS